MGVAAFVFDGKEWLSCEQCFQACKSLDPAYSEAIRGIQKQPGQTDSAHGMECWSEGQRHKMCRRPDWDAVKIEIMYRANVAKYRAHAHLQRDLLSTGCAVLNGAASTSWACAGKMHNWSVWNGLIQMRIREELRPVAERRPGLLESLVAKMEAYMQTAGGAQAAIPS